MPTFLILHKSARTSDPKVPPIRGFGGVNKSSREICLRVARARVSFLFCRGRARGSTYILFKPSFVVVRIEKSYLTIDYLTTRFNSS